MLWRVAPESGPERNVRLDTLVRLRWLAVFGQTAAILIVHHVLDFELDLWPCLIVVSISAWLNIALSLQQNQEPRIRPDRAAWLLAFDIAQLAALLYLTGGLQNPFAFLFLAPVIVGAMALPPQYTLLLGGLAVSCATLLVFVHQPLPWASDDPLTLPPIYMLGVWLSILLALIYIGVYAWQIAEGARKLSDALSATELVLAREQHMSQIDGLAAAAAHELATPLSTIVLVAKELERALEKDSPHTEDVQLLRSEAQRCREILSKLTELSADESFDRVTLTALIEEIVLPHREFGIDIDIVMPQDRAGEPITRRTPALLYGLGNLVDNAVDFAKERVEIAARWSSQEITLTIADDGPGFSAAVKDRLGEPFLTTRGRKRVGPDGEPEGLGLGFFIAKTLLERSGATIAFANRAAPDHGAVVSVRWKRAEFDDSRPSGAQSETANA
ncbi:sensor histidine kinase RegB [Variibacter gotjawalensis]|uniref:histidine kinase n=1 Tax=Variibacter gotjawalensis TaxID=1333996 RepID=A0A0S3Q062_9BRAD|nr:ActS/PrrB/RegB family redox-sensitive histidine kinase [Variibacter gotjawalensis]NIK47420.1 two-component system sensor histidine kinase RegB [Variibacter gotjawalensis]RZS49316.1 two-component system sensor histidine kinase RegB [Variibacter gotjawalensis]BAT61580.1 sensor histidine kinase RegB [Variibacter gotjawalensis]